MKGPWRFRANWRGQLILQRNVTRSVGDGYDMWTVAEWRDATAEDLLEFFKEQTQ